ncbi:DUF302 domain-containing protein [Actinomadura scrupuli]|uniref:DUF302 domain-containing protein n=1 Tax=Actinomadura scrupuli TaxID=559629 RepID=UPI003D96A770
MAQSSRGRIHTAPHEVNRLSIEVPESFEDFRARYERAVPPFETGRFERLIKDDAGWETVVAATEENAPHGFIIYWSGDFRALLGLAGERLPCVEYLMGNHMIAQRMYHHDPAVLLYAPLRTAIYQDAGGAAWFTVDQPSTQFSAFGNPDIARVGLELDRKLATLLEYLGTPVPEVLTAGPPH